MRQRYFALKLLFQIAGGTKKPTKEGTKKGTRHDVSNQCQCVVRRPYYLYQPKIADT